MHVIGHETIALHPHLILRGLFTRQRQVLQVIGLLEEDRSAIVPALRDMPRETGYHDTSGTWHGNSIAVMG